jgi:hypothetical protein
MVPSQIEFNKKVSNAFTSRDIIESMKNKELSVTEQLEHLAWMAHEELKKNIMLETELLTLKKSFTKVNESVKVLSKLAKKLQRVNKQLTKENDLKA